MDEANKTIQCLQDQVERLEAKVQRLQKSKLEKVAMAAMQGLLANPNTVILDTDGKPLFKGVAIWAVKQAKALLAELEKEG